MLSCGSQRPSSSSHGPRCLLLLLPFLPLSFKMGSRFVTQAGLERVFFHGITVIQHHETLPLHHVTTLQSPVTNTDPVSRNKALLSTCR